MWILSHVPSAIALSLFILKSSNWEKINDASFMWYCQIIDCLLVETCPCTLHKFRVAKSTLFVFLTVYYVHYALPNAVLDCLFFIFFLDLQLIFFIV